LPLCLILPIAVYSTSAYHIIVRNNDNTVRAGAICIFPLALSSPDEVPEGSQYVGELICIMILQNCLKVYFVWL